MVKTRKYELFILRKKCSSAEKSIFDQSNASYFYWHFVQLLEMGSTKLCYFINMPPKEKINPFIISSLGDWCTYY